METIKKWYYDVKCRKCGKVSRMFHSTFFQTSAKDFVEWAIQHSSFPIQQGCECDRSMVINHDLIAYLMVPEDEVEKAMSFFNNNINESLELTRLYPSDPIIRDALEYGYDEVRKIEGIERKIQFLKNGEVMKECTPRDIFDLKLTIKGNDGYRWIADADGSSIRYLDFLSSNSKLRKP